jgi:hypothetical protein
MMVIFLVGLVAMILMRTLRKDFASFPKDEDEAGEVSFYDRTNARNPCCFHL